MSFKVIDECKIGDLVITSNTGLDAIKRAPIVSDDTGIKCLRIQDVSQKKNYEEWGFCEVTENNFKNFQLYKDDVIIARTGDTVGVNLIIQQNLKAVFNNGLIRLRANLEKVLPSFLFYNFQSREFYNHIDAVARGASTQPNLRIQNLLDYRIKVPELATQQKVVSILSSLDDKIELNRQTNETLEALAQALFKEWFVDFNFPGATGEMVESEWGLIPKGWVIRKIKEIGKVVTGTTPPGNNPEYYGNLIPFITPTDFKDYSKIIITADRYLSHQGSELLKNRLLPKNSIVVTCIGSDMGKVAINKVEAITNQQINSILTQDYTADYLYHFLLNKYDLLRSMATGGSTMPIINKSQFEEIRVAMPSNEILERFWKVLQPLNDTIENQIQEKKSLTDVRNNLLPKLLKGEINL